MSLFTRAQISIEGIITRFIVNILLVNNLVISITTYYSYIYLAGVILLKIIT